MFIKISNNQIEKYPYTATDLYRDFPDTSFPSDLTNADLSDLGVYKISTVQKPSVDYTQVVEEQSPELINDMWTQVWLVRPASAEEQSTAMAKITRQFTDAIQNYLDVTAQTRNYSNIISACSYAAGTHPKYSLEGKACLSWREAVWDKSYEILNDVQAGNRPIPTIEQVISELPPMEWPNITVD